MNPTTLNLRSALAAGLLGAAACGVARAQTYTVTDLGTAGGPIATAFGINEAGHAAGASVMASANYRGTLSAGGAVSMIAPLAGDSQCWAFALDGSDRIAAVSYSTAGLTARGLLWQAGSVTPLGNFAPRAMNSGGSLAGFTQVTDPGLGPLEHAALWSGGATTDLGTLGGSSSYAMGINGVGQVVGWSALAGDLGTHAALWQGGTARDLGTLGGAGSQAYAISDTRIVTGWAQTATGEPHAFVFTVDASGVVTLRIDLGVLGGGYSYGYGVNGAGDVVGTSSSRAFMWHAGAMTDLNTAIPAGSGWVLERAWAINSAGQIVGEGLHNGFPRAFLLSAACYANCDGSATPPVLNVNDFICFLDRYAAGEAYANCDGSATPPVLNVNDFVCFLNRYAQGCP